jgi:DNA-binding Lrp family transcriptional regulator
MEFDKNDKSILDALYHNWRAPSSKLAKQLRLSRRQVDYRIKQYFSSKIIRTIFTIADYSKLGYHKPFYIFIKLNKREYVPKIGKYLRETKRCTSWGRVWTEYDIFSNFIFKNKKEVANFIKKLKATYKNEIEEIVCVDPIHSDLYPLKSIGDNLKETYTLAPKSNKKIKVDQVDLKILKEIRSDARKSIIKISEKVRISPERCLYRLRRLYKEKVILGSRIQFDLKESGYFATCLFIDTELSSGLSDKIKKFCLLNENINLSIIAKKSPNIVLQVFHKDEKTLREVIKNISDIFDKKFKISIVSLEDDINIINPLPFLD